VRKVLERAVGEGESVYDLKNPAKRAVLHLDDSPAWLPSRHAPTRFVRSFWQTHVPIALDSASDPQSRSINRRIAHDVSALSGIGAIPLSCAYQQRFIE
jgi:hypothetical protein